MNYVPASNRYAVMKYNRCGRSGIKLPAISLGFWHNFGDIDIFENGRAIVRKAFDLGITHFDLANGYGPPMGAAEENFGMILKNDLSAYRNELIISTKAGFEEMWPGPYGDWASRKHLLASVDQSLRRLGLDYVDIFYSHRFDPETPLEETMSAMDAIVREGKALYVGISSYPPEKTKEAARILRNLGTPCLIHQPWYSLLNRRIEEGLQDVLDEEGIGSIAFCPLEQGLLTGKYLSGVPSDSRAAKSMGDYHCFNAGDGNVKFLEKIWKLNEVAKARGQSLAQMSIAWVLRKGRVTSALIGASKPSQLEENVAALDNLDFSKEELQLIDEILA